MKNPVYTLACAVILLSACSSKSKNRNETQAFMQDSTKVAGLQRMQAADVKAAFTYNGKEYQSSVVLSPDEGLPVVTNEQGEKFVDNRIALRISGGGKQVVDKVFTKASFASLLDAKFMKYAILESLAFNRATPRGMIYVASVCYPQSDLYVLIKLTVDADGKISMEKGDFTEDHQPDSTNYNE